MIPKFAIVNSKGRVLCAGKGEEQAKYLWVLLKDGVSPVVFGSRVDAEWFVTLKQKDSLRKREWRDCKVIEFDGTDVSESIGQGDVEV